ncbi:MAG: hypothetical protein QG580_181 [Patescibacteria group bacterium]|jgi:hypothetical protein|nr:hypothetical protein [Patescibacteria group bacterium]
MSRFNRKAQKRANKELIIEQLTAEEETRLAIEAEMQKIEDENARDMEEFLREFPEESRLQYGEDMDALDRARGRRGIFRNNYQDGENIDPFDYPGNPEGSMSMLDYW